VSSSAVAKKCAISIQYIPVRFIHLCFRLAYQLNNVLGHFEVNLNDYTEIEVQLDKLESSLNNLKPEVEYFYLFAQDTEQTQKKFDVSSRSIIILSYDHRRRVVKFVGGGG